MSDFVVALIGFAVLAVAAALVLVWSRRRHEDSPAARIAASEARADEQRSRNAELEQQLQSLRDQLVAIQVGRAAAEARMDEARRSAEGQERALEDAKAQLREAFKALAADALADSRKDLSVAGDRLLSQLSEKGTAELDARKAAVEELVTPLREAVEAYRREAEQLEQRRQRQLGDMERQYEQLSVAAGGLQQETAKLVNALRSPHVRGRWGQITLRRAAELAGMVDHCDFYEQESAPDGRLRPDMLVRLPGQRLVVLDAKVPLDGYLGAIGTSDEAERDEALTRHARQTRDHIKSLASKEYQEQFEQAPDFVVAFIPSDSILAAAVERDPDLVEFALSRAVVIATPSSFFALLRVIAHGWRREQMAEHAERVRGLGAQLAERLQVFLTHFEKLGGAIRRSVEIYNETVGSLESRVLPSARKFRELGVTTRVMPEPEQVDVAPRSVLLPGLQEGAQEIFPEQEDPGPDNDTAEPTIAPWAVGSLQDRALFTCRCRICGANFEGTGPNAQYCSDACRAVSRDQSHRDDDLIGTRGDDEERAD